MESPRRPLKDASSPVLRFISFPELVARQSARASSVRDVQTGKVLQASGRAQLSVGAHLRVVAEERAVDELLAERIGRVP